MPLLQIIAAYCAEIDTFIWAEITMVMMRHLQPLMTLCLNGMALRYDWSVSDEN